jgi:Animal haem peroxidase
MSAPTYYTRMFSGAKPGQYSEADLIALADLMVDDDDPSKPAMVKGPHGPEAATPPSRSLISGLLYLAQLVDHDVSLDRTRLCDAVKVTPENRVNWRSPFLDLDSVYGGGPEVSPWLYYLPIKNLTGPALLPGQERFLIGTTAPSQLPCDLPRTTAGRPVIAEPRNEENLILAQLHVLMLRFHNRVVAALEDKEIDDGGLTGSYFSKAQQLVTWHYQYIVIHELLDVLLDRTILNDALANCAPLSSIPIEFALAGFRVGHSMIRNGYKMNAAHANAPLTQLLNLNSMGVPPLTRLPDEWIIDWRRFFGGFAMPAEMLNRSHGLDTLVAKALHHLGFPTSLEDTPNSATTFSLPAITLLRGSRSGLPSGQAMATEFGEALLTDDEMEVQQAIPIMDALKRFGFLNDTPLWFYILQESCVRTKKCGVGPTGSRLIANTLVGLLKADRDSILNAGKAWQPPTWKSRGITVKTMADLLRIATGSR